MTIYVDLVCIINYLFDVLLLIVVNKTLKRNIKLRRILLSSIIGELSLLLLLIKNNYILFILKFIIALLLNIACFRYKDILYTINNLAYFYMSSIILGGFIYLLKLKEVNYLMILSVSPVILYLYIKENKNLLLDVKNYYSVKIYFSEDEIISTMGYLDTGNKLKDPVTNKNVVLVNKKLIESMINIRSPMYVSYQALNSKGLVKCYKPLKIELDNKYNDKFLIGVMDEKIGISGVDCILNLEVIEGMKCYD